MWDERVAQLDRLAHEREHLWEHPRLVARAVGRAIEICVPGVDREPRVEDAVLDGNQSLVIAQANNRTFAAQIVLKKMLETLK